MLAASEAPMTRYQIGAGSQLRVTARSRVHDTSTTWDTITGEVVRRGAARGILTPVSSALLTLVEVLEAKP